MGDGPTHSESAIMKAHDSALLTFPCTANSAKHRTFNGVPLLFFLVTVKPHHCTVGTRSQPSWPLPIFLGWPCVHFTWHDGIWHFVSFLSPPCNGAVCFSVRSAYNTYISCCPPKLCRTAFFFFASTLRQWPTASVVLHASLSICGSPFFSTKPWLVRTILLPSALQFHVPWPTFASTRPLHAAQAFCWCPLGTCPSHWSICRHSFPKIVSWAVIPRSFISQRYLLALWLLSTM